MITLLSTMSGDKKTYYLLWCSMVGGITPCGGRLFIEDNNPQI